MSERLERWKMEDWDLDSAGNILWGIIFIVSGISVLNLRMKSWDRHIPIANFG